MPETKRYSDLFIDDGLDCLVCKMFVNPFVIEQTPAYKHPNPEIGMVPARVCLECPREECKVRWYVTDESWTADPDAAHSN